MKIFDNITEIVRDDLQKTIKKNGKVSVAAACFSMYAYQELNRSENSIYLNSTVRTAYMVQNLKSNYATN